MLADTLAGQLRHGDHGPAAPLRHAQSALLSRFDDVVIVAELTLQWLRDSNRLMKLMAVRNRQAKVHVVADQVAAQPDVTVKEFEAGMEGSPLRFPARPEGEEQVDDEGAALVASDPGHRMVADLHKLCIELAGVPEEAKTALLLAQARQGGSAPWTTASTRPARPRVRIRSRCCAPPPQRLRQALGAEGLAKASPLELAETANEVLDALVAGQEARPTLAEQRQLLREVVEAARAERAAAT